eukprot:1639045-Prymnesium_polylepis.1
MWSDKLVIFGPLGRANKCSGCVLDHSLPGETVLRTSTRLLAPWQPLQPGPRPVGSSGPGRYKLHSPRAPHFLLQVRQVGRGTENGRRRGTRRVGVVYRNGCK